MDSLSGLYPFHIPTSKPSNVAAIGTTSSRNNNGTYQQGMGGNTSLSPHLGKTLTDLPFEILKKIFVSCYPEWAFSIELPTTVEDRILETGVFEQFHEVKIGVLTMVSCGRTCSTLHAVTKDILNLFKPLPRAPRQDVAECANHSALNNWKDVRKMHQQQLIKVALHEQAELQMDIEAVGIANIGNFPTSDWRSAV